MEISYKYDDKVTVDELFNLLDKMMEYKKDQFPAKNVFHVDLRTREKEAESLDNTISVTARDDQGSMVGYLRVLTDNAYIFYILDVMVDPKNRKNGIGQNLLNHTLKKCKKHGFIKIFLTAIPGTESFYKQFDFKSSMSPVLTLRGEDYKS